MKKWGGDHAFVGDVAQGREEPTHVAPSERRVAAEQLLNGVRGLALELADGVHVGPRDAKEVPVATPGTQIRVPVRRPRQRGHDRGVRE